MYSWEASVFLEKTKVIKKGQDEPIYCPKLRIISRFFDEVIIWNASLEIKCP